MIIKLFEKYSKELKEVKNLIIERAADTEVEIVDFFVKRGYDINCEEAIYNSTFDDNILRYFLKNDADFENHPLDYQFKSRLKELIVQKALIDFDKELFIFNTVGFNPKLKEDPKYSEIIERVENMEKYNF